jgi:tape measure domain-containing protein
MAEGIAVEVQDSISPSVRKSLLNIAEAAREGFTAVERLNKVLQQTSVNKLIGSTNQLRNAVGGLASETAKAGLAMGQATQATLGLQNAQDRAARSVAGHTQSFVGFLRSLAALAGAGAGVGALVKLGDEYTNLQNKLQNVTTSQEQVNKLTEELFAIANRTRTPIDATATAFTRFDRALKILGKSQQDTLNLTETINKAFIVSGASTNEARSGLLQLSQAFNAGKLQGDEFRSVSENVPIILDAIAKATGKPVNQLKQLAKEGKITSKVMFDAFQILAAQVDETFAKTVPTVSQAMQVLRNSVEQAFGEFNKQVGFTDTLAKSIIFLSKHVKELAVGAVALGSALLVAFGPAVLTAIASVGAALLANPIGLVAVGIATATAALFAFGNEIEIAGGKGATLLDVFKSTFSYVAEGAVEATRTLRDIFSATIDAINDRFGNIIPTFSTVLDNVLTISKNAVNNIIGAFVAAYDAIRIIWTKAPELFEYIFKSIANSAINGAESVLNSYQTSIRGVASAIGAVAPDMAKSINSTLDTIKITLPKFDIKPQAAGAAADLKTAVTNAFNKDYLGDAGKAILNRATQMADNRSEMQRQAARARAATANQLRGAGPDTTGVDDDKKGAKAAESRALMLARVNGELDKQLRSYGLLASERYVQQQLDEVDIKLAARKFPLLTTGINGEREQLKVKLEQIEVNKRIQAQQDQIYEGVEGPLKTHQAGIQATNILLERQLISETKAAETVRRLSYEYRQATEPLFQFNRDIEDQNKLLGYNSREREIQSQLLQLQNSLSQKGIDLTKEETAVVTEQLRALRDKNELVRAIDQIESQTSGARQTILTQLQATTQAYVAGTIALSDYQRRIVDLGVATANLNLSNGIGTFEDHILASVGRMREGFTNVLGEMTKSFGDFFVTIEDGFANSIGRAIVYGDSLKESLYSVAQQGVSALIASLVKVGIQYLVNAAIGESALAATTAANVAASQITALAWAEAAALVSLATFGANAVPASAAIASTSALTHALAAIPAFDVGGYTGNMGRSQMAGIVHGQEFVTNAAATARNRPALEAMNRGATVGSSNVSITVENHGTPQTYDKEIIGRNEIRLIARDVVVNEAPNVISADLAQANSKTSKALRGTHNVTRSR